MPSWEYQVVNGVYNLGFYLGYLHGDQKIKKVGYNQGGILGSYLCSTWDMIGDSYLGSIWSTLRTTIWVQSRVQTVKCLGISHFIIVRETKTAKSLPSAKDLLSRGATGPALRCNAGQP